MVLSCIIYANPPAVEDIECRLFKNVIFFKSLKDCTRNAGYVANAVTNKWFSKREKKRKKFLYVTTSSRWFCVRRITIPINRENQTLMDLE